MSHDSPPRRSSLSRPIRDKKKAHHPGCCRPRRLGVDTDTKGIRMLPALDRVPGTVAIKLHDLEVQAALRGDKHEIRRPLRLVQEIGEVTDLRCPDADAMVWQFNRGYSADRNHYEISLQALVSRCPYGVRGGRIQILEAWAWDEESQAPIYRADHLTTHQRQDLHNRGVVWKSQPPPPGGPRIVYEIVDVWVDRLQPMEPFQLRNEGWIDSRLKRLKPSDVAASRQAFANSWDRSTLFEESHWKHNPWVWVISVRRIGT